MLIAGQEFPEFPWAFGKDTGGEQGEFAQDRP